MMKLTVWSTTFILLGLGGCVGSDPQALLQAPPSQGPSQYRPCPPASKSLSPAASSAQPMVASNFNPQGATPAQQVPLLLQGKKAPAATPDLKGGGKAGATVQVPFPAAGSKAAPLASIPPVPAVPTRSLHEVVSDPKYPFRWSAFQDGVQLCSCDGYGHKACQNYFVKGPWHITSNP